VERGEVIPASRSEEQQTEEISFADVLDELCVFYMAIGVSYEDFWYGDYCKLKYYRRSYEKQYEMKNEQAWLQGIYIQKAFEVVMDNFGYSLNGGKGRRPSTKYPESPFAITENEKKMEKQRNINKTLKWVEEGQK